MNNTAKRENAGVKKMFEHIQKEGPAVLLKKIRIDGSNIVLIENKWNERDDRKSVTCNLVKEIENETAGLYINIKHGQPTTDQVFDAVYGRGAKCKIRVIIYDGKVSDANCCNPAADEFVVDSLITAMNAYPLNLHLVKLMSNDSEDDQHDMEGFTEPTPEYTMQELPSPEEFRIAEFWCVYFDSLDEDGYASWRPFSAGLRESAKRKLTLYTEKHAEIQLNWENDGIKFIVKQTDESVDYLQRIWSLKQDELKQDYDGRVEFEYLPGKLPKIIIHHSDRLLSWLVTATSQEKDDFAKDLHEDFYGLRYYLDDVVEEIEALNAA